MKSTLHFLILAYLMFNLLLAGVKALSEVPPNSPTESLTPKLNSDNGNSNLMNLEKRAAPHQYNFGIGKKSYNFDSIDDEDIEEDSYDEGQEIKRADPNRFAFGIGKRAIPEQRFAFGIGKKSELPRKRLNENRFQFGIGKRASRDSRFAFGLGKRENDFEEYIKRRYSFGLGKRSAQDSSQSYFLSGSQ